MPVDWDDVPGATHYSIRLRKADPGNPLGAPRQAQSSFIRIAGFANDDEEWVVRVEACNDAGCGLGAARRFTVPQPQQQQVATPEPTPTPERPWWWRPPGPSGLQGDTQPGSLDVQVSWDEVEEASDYSVRWRLAFSGNALNQGVNVHSPNAAITVADYGEWVVNVRSCASDVGCGSPREKRFSVVPAPKPPAAAGDVDYDIDNDGLIEVSNLTQLNAIRWDADGDGTSDGGNGNAGYAEAFPEALEGKGCPNTGCVGYELTADLDFDTNGNGESDAGDTYWNSGKGWSPVPRFSAIFDGGEHTISNLYSNQSHSTLQYVYDSDEWGGGTIFNLQVLRGQADWPAGR